MVEKLLIVAICLLSLLMIGGVIFIIMFLSKKRADEKGKIFLLEETQRALLTLQEGIQKSILSETERLAFLERERIDGMQKNVETYLKYSDERINQSLKNVAENLSESSRRNAQTIAQLSLNMENLRTSVESTLGNMTKQNKASIDEMRIIVDEKLSTTLETRLNQSFEIINKSLSDVNQGLGDMQTLAKDVGGLKNVLSNVKVRGTWAELQLDNLLSQMLTKDQYVKNCLINDKANERVDFAIRLPGKDKEVLLPIDAKFPIEQYNKLIASSQVGDVIGIDKALKELETRIKEEAKSISSKYIRVPKTTDFAIMYLPTEGLYAEVVKREGLQELLQRDFRVMICGPSTLGAMLSSLQMGFKTVAIEKKSSEIHHLLLVFKREFVKFNELLEKTQKKISEASSTIEDASKKTRTITRKLGKVEEFSQGLLSDSRLSEEDDED